MAHEDSPPRSKAILFWGVVSSVLLLSLVPLFHTYFDHMTQSQTVSHLEGRACGTDDDCGGRLCLEQGVCESKLTQHRRLTRAKVGGSVEDAIKQMGARGRNVGAVVAPKPSDSLDAVRGWGKDPHDTDFQQAEKAVARVKKLREAAAQRAREAAKAAAIPTEAVPQPVGVRPPARPAPVRPAPARPAPARPAPGAPN